MSSIVKVDTIQDTQGNNIINESSDTITIGASGDTISIPSGATITNSGTANGFGGGKIGQVVSATLTGTFTSNSDSMVDITGLTAAITPAATSSKVLVMVNFHVGGTVNDRYAVFQLLRGSTAICIGDAASSRSRGSAAHVRITATGTQNEILTKSISFLDSPSSSSEQTYKMQGLNQSDNDPSFTINRSGNDTDAAHGFRLASTITLMEVLA